MEIEKKQSVWEAKHCEGFQGRVATSVSNGLESNWAIFPELLYPDPVQVSRMWLGPRSIRT